MILINPPVTRPCEPPAGLARLVGALRSHGCSYLAVDSNIEGLIFLLEGNAESQDTWTRRAVNHLEGNLAALTSAKGFENMGRYTRAVTELNRILVCTSRQANAHVTLGNFSQAGLSPVSSADLLCSAEQQEKNIFYPYFKKRLLALFEKYSPHTVGFSLNYLSQAITCFAMAGFIRTACPDVKIVLGGGLVTSWMKRPDWNNPFSGLIDDMTAGPGEERVLSLAGAEYSGEDPLPDYSPFRKNSYLSPGKTVPFSTSFGCYWGKCSFCPERSEGNRYSCLSKDRVFSDLDCIIEQESPNLIHLCDNALSPALLERFASREIACSWYGFARITHHLCDPDFCSALKRSGCVMLKLGLESGDQRVLDELGKGISLEVAASALKTLRNAGIATYVYLLFGTPTEDEGSARKTLDFTVKHSESVDFLNLSIFNLPREDTREKALETFDFSKGDLSLYQGFIHPRAWNRNNVRQFLDKEFKRHSAIAPIVRNDPPVFTSNHAPFFVLNRRG
ncbi:MAG: radical SAM protein [Deltaproteobacteria bacterium]|nr:radical SAM protein [Deltaproteobacteria bacterium]